MISVSSNYNAAAIKAVRNVNAKLSIGSVNFGIDDIVSVELTRSPSDGGISVGGTSSARFIATFRGSVDIEDKYVVTFSVGFPTVMKIGTFYIVEVQRDKGFTTIEAYDRFYFLDKPCNFNGSADGKISALQFPATHQEMLEYISKINGFSLSVTCETFAKVKTKPIYNSEATNPTNKYYTYREIIGFIAACNGCNAQFDANDKLIFTRPSNSVETVDEGSCESCTVAQDDGFTVKGIRFTIGTDTAFYIDANGTAYNESLPGIIEAVNPLATVEIMEFVWNKLGGYHYFAVNVSRRGRGWLFPDDVVEVTSNGTTKKATITAISYSLSKDSGFSEQITSTAESTEQSSNRYSAAGDHTSNAGAGKYNSTTIINDPVIISEKTKEYLKYDYSIVGYNGEDKITYGHDSNDIIVQGYVLSPYRKPIASSAKYQSYTFVNTSIYRTVTIYPFILYMASEQKDSDGNLYTLYYVRHEVYGEKIDGTSWEEKGNTLTTRNADWGGAFQYSNIYAPDDSYPYGSVNIYSQAYLTNNDGTYSAATSPGVGRVPFASMAEYNAAMKLTRSPVEKKDVIQAVSKIIEAGGTADFPELGETDVLYIDSTDNSAYKWSSKISAYYCVGRDYFSIKKIRSSAEPNSSEAEILEAQLLQDMRSPTEWTLHASFVPPKGYICITEFESGQHGIKIGDGNTPWSELLYVNIYDLSGYLKSDEIADWAKADEKPVYTAEEVGAAAKKHTHTKSDIADFPTLGTAAGKNVDYFATAGHTHTAEEVGAAAKKHTHTKSEITDFPTLGTAAGKNIDYFAVAGHTHTAAEIGAAAKSHTHTKSQITDFPTLGTAAGKNIDYFAAAEHTHTVDEVGAAAEKHTHTKSDITDMPASLPANGGNADTVDGKHANAFYPAKANFALGLDYNSLTSNGIFELLGNESNPTKNAPNGNDASNNFYVQVFVHSTAFLTQIATSVRSDKTQYIRSMSNGTWNAWGKIKSGDADTVDGKHASDFAVAGHTHTAEEVGAAAKKHTHTKSEITDFPTLGTAAGKNIDYFATAGHTHTAEEVGAAAKKHTHTKSEITDFPTLGTAAGKNIDYFAAAEHTHTAAEIGAATAANITAAVNAVSIGGRNIVTGSETLTIGTGKRAKGHWRTSGSSGNGEILGTFRESMPSCGEITAISIDCYTLGAEYGITQDNVPLDKDSYYTLSCWVRSGSSNNARCALQPFWKSSTDSGGRKYFVVGPSWTRLSFTSTKKPAATGNYSAGYVLAVPNDDYPEPTISVCGIKLEKGNKPTDWTPAPEDAERRITSLEARVAALEAAAVSGGEV